VGYKETEVDRATACVAADKVDLSWEALKPDILSRTEGTCKREIA
jgi:hypothetical protein